MKAIVMFVLILGAIFSGYLIGQQNIVTSFAEVPLPANTTLCEPQAEISANKVKPKITKWEISDKITLSIVIKHLEKGCDKDFGFDSCDDLSILDEKGKRLFHQQDLSISIERYLTSKQIIFELNGGGTDDFLIIIEYRNGSIVEIIDSLETQMRGGFWTMPEYRTGNSGPYFKPVQIFIINQLGGADPNPYCSVFRYQEGFYKKAGEFKMQTLGDFIEKEIVKK